MQIHELNTFTGAVGDNTYLAIDNGSDTSKINASDIVTPLLAPIESDMSVLEARMDSFTNLAEGSTTGDAELIDGRVGADGVTYTNIGGAIRSQVSDLKSDLGSFPPFLTIGDTLYKSLRWEKGSIRDNTNTEVSNDARLRSNYAEVYTNSITLNIPNGFLVYLFEFANDKAFIYEGGWHTGTKKVTLKSTTKYIRIIVKNSAGDSSISVSDGKRISAYEYSFLTQKEYKISGTEIDWHSGWINKNTGAETDTGSTSYRCTNFIKLPTQLAFNTIIFASYASGDACSIAFYDTSKAFISAFTRADATSLEVELPTGAVYVKLTTYPSSLSTDNTFFIVYIKPIDCLVDMIKACNSLLIADNEIWG